MSRQRLSPETVSQIDELLVRGWRNLSIANHLGVKRVTVGYYRQRYVKQCHGITTKQESTYQIRETEAQSIAFANAMRGQTFTNVHTKAYGRPPVPAATHVLSESGIARCG